MAYSAINFKGKQVIAVEPIDAMEFEDLVAFGKLVKKQGLHDVIVTQAAWDKYEDLLLEPEEEL